MVASFPAKHTRCELEKHGITYELNYNTVKLPPHVQRLKDILCDFRGLLPENKRADYEKEAQILRNLENVRASGQKQSLASRAGGNTASKEFTTPPKDAYYSSDTHFQTTINTHDILYAEEKSKADLVTKEARALAGPSQQAEVEWMPLLSKEIFSRYSERMEINGTIQQYAQTVRYADS
jgi:hypothetical protein